jgi:hypothetical protein
MSLIILPNPGLSSTNNTVIGPFIVLGERYLLDWGLGRAAFQGRRSRPMMIRSAVLFAR